MRSFRKGMVRAEDVTQEDRRSRAFRRTHSNALARVTIRACRELGCPKTRPPPPVAGKGLEAWFPGKSDGPEHSGDVEGSKRKLENQSNHLAVACGIDASSISWWTSSNRLRACTSSTSGASRRATSCNSRRYGPLSALFTR
ncbi:uncharacterized protein LOC113562626 [Ooceraea biroi]|uniref:uncharacterized protein LOC113562626 n=1 Tax=Ooceraea biroi TaxID=2015173 RepID=UPI000F076A5F|nr:uncharacterized protein LOC113562626 [Ooceraea biroi]